MSSCCDAVMHVNVRHVCVVADERHPRHRDMRGRRAVERDRETDPHSHLSGSSYFGVQVRLAAGSGNRSPGERVLRLSLFPLLTFVYQMIRRPLLLLHCMTQTCITRGGRRGRDGAHALTGSTGGGKTPGFRVLTLFRLLVSSSSSSSSSSSRVVYFVTVNECQAEKETRLLFPLLLSLFSCLTLVSDPFPLIHSVLLIVHICASLCLKTSSHLFAVRVTD